MLYFSKYFSNFILVISVALSTANIEDDGCFDSQKRQVCVTPGCVRAASDILSTIDESVDPCDDFYQFACGTFVKNSIIPDDELLVMKNVKVQNQVNEQLRVMIEEPIAQNVSKPFVVLKKMYNTCMDVDAIEKTDLTLAKKYLEEIGGWPVVDGDVPVEDSFDWKTMIYQIRKTGFYHSGFFNVYVGINVLNTSQNIISIDECSTNVPKEYLQKGFSDNVARGYYQYMVNFAVEFGANLSFAQKEAKDVVDFEIKLTELLVLNEERRNMTAMTHQMTISDLEVKYPQFPWFEYITNVLNLPFLNVTREEMIDVAVPTFIPKIDVLLRETPKRVLKNYIAWVFIEELAMMLPERIRDLKFNFTQITTGVQTFPSRWKMCVGEVSRRMDIATSALYVRKYFDDNAKKNVVVMIEDVKKTFINTLKNLDWMDDATRAHAIEKARAMVNHVAYPKELMDDRKIEEYYSEFEFSDNYLVSYLNYQKFYLVKLFGDLRKPVNKSDWIYHATTTTVNAYYSVAENGFELPAGILQDVFFSNDRPQYMNYGGIGFIVGHEITHGFDDQGRQTNEHGQLVDWWTKETEATFIKKAQCFIDQYSNFTLPNSNISVNGKNTQGENIADNGALKVAYLAYQSWVKRNSEEPFLPGLYYTPNQMFWIAVANIWCSKERPEILEKMAMTANHSPSNYRVIGSMRNSEYFTKDFKCSVGSKMNPSLKCSIW